MQHQEQPQISDELRKEAESSVCWSTHHLTLDKLSEDDKVWDGLKTSKAAYEARVVCPLSVAALVGHVWVDAYLIWAFADQDYESEGEGEESIPVSKKSIEKRIADLKSLAEKQSELLSYVSCENTLPSCTAVLEDALQAWEHDSDTVKTSLAKKFSVGWTDQFPEFDTVRKARDRCRESLISGLMGRYEDRNFMLRIGQATGDDHIIAAQEQVVQELIGTMSAALNGDDQDEAGIGNSGTLVDETIATLTRMGSSGTLCQLAFNQVDDLRTAIREFKTAWSESGSLQDLLKGTDASSIPVQEDLTQ